MRLILFVLFYSVVVVFFFKQLLFQEVNNPGKAVVVLICTVELFLSHFPESLLRPPFCDNHCGHQKFSLGLAYR